MKKNKVTRIPLKRPLFFIFFLLSGFAVSPAWAKGKTAAVPFLNLDVSARAAGMGGAQSAVVNDASALVANPAALRQLIRPSASLFHATYVDSSYYDFVGYGRRVGRVGAFGVGAQFLSQGEIEKIDADGNTTGNLTPNDVALSLGYARDFSDFIFGVGGKYIQSKLVDFASDVAVDAGILTPPLMENKLRLAATVSNIGPPIKYQSESQALPTRARAGATFSPTSQWTWAADAVFPNAGDAFGALGVEYHLPLDGPLKVDLRSGYNTQSKDLESMSGLSGGIGFNGANFGVDYALVTLGELGLSHRFSLNFRFGPETKPPPHSARAAPRGGPDPFVEMAGELSENARAHGVHRIAVMAFEPVNSQGAMGGRVVQDRLISAFVKKGTVSVVERNRLDAVKKELTLGMTGLLDESTTKHIGKVLGVDALVLGSLSNTGEKMVEANARIVLVETGEILGAVTEQMKQTWLDPEQTVPPRRLGDSNIP